ncbi:hypothetical protein DL93DRAFT_773660 [Clavulina sp. PMI_390]|nr:hypothetical protein DL93DRAFT_773660 [Clavulina sp. PMI_390]
MAWDRVIIDKFRPADYFTVVQATILSGKCAWSRATVPLPPLSPPALVLPGFEWLLLDPSLQATTLNTTEISAIEGLNAKGRQGVLSSSGYHARYLEIIHVRHQLCQPRVIMECLTVAPPYILFSQSRKSGLYLWRRSVFLHG